MRCKRRLFGFPKTVFYTANDGKRQGERRQIGFYLRFRCKNECPECAIMMRFGDKKDNISHKKCN